MIRKISQLPGKKSKAKFKRTALNVIPLLPQITRKGYTVHENVRIPFSGETRKKENPFFEKAFRRKRLCRKPPSKLPAHLRI